MHAELARAAPRPSASSSPASSRQPRVGKAHRLQPRKPLRVGWQAVPPHPLLGVDDLARCVRGTSGSILAGGVDLLDRQPVAIGLGDTSRRSGVGLASAARDRVLVAARDAGDLDLVEAGEAGLQRAQRLLQRFGEAAADRHRLADRFHRGGEQRLGAGEFLEGEARHLGDDVIDRRLERGRRRRR